MHLHNVNSVVIHFDNENKLIMSIMSTSTVRVCRLSLIKRIREIDLWWMQAVLWASDISNDADRKIFSKSPFEWREELVCSNFSKWKFPPLWSYQVYVWFTTNSVSTENKTKLDYNAIVTKLKQHIKIFFSYLFSCFLKKWKIII